MKSEEIERCGLCKYCRVAEWKGDDRGYCTWTLGFYKPPEAGRLVVLSLPHTEPLPKCPGFERKDNE